MDQRPVDIAFTPAVKAAQGRNRQFITTGNLAENPKAYIFLMDYAHRQRIRIRGTARVVKVTPDLNSA